MIERASVVRCSRGFAEAVLLRRKYAVMKDVATADEPVVLAPQQKDRVPGHEWKNNTTNLIVYEQHLNHSTTNARVEHSPFFIRLEHRVHG